MHPLCSYPAPAPPVFYTLSLHDALPIWRRRSSSAARPSGDRGGTGTRTRDLQDGLEQVTPDRLLETPTHSIHECIDGILSAHRRSEEHTSELQSRFDLVCRLLLEKKK